MITVPMWLTLGVSCSLSFFVGAAVGSFLMFKVMLQVIAEGLDRWCEKARKTHE